MKNRPPLYGPQIIETLLMLRSREGNIFNYVPDNLIFKISGYYLKALAQPRLITDEQRLNKKFGLMAEAKIINRNFETILGESLYDLERIKGIPIEEKEGEFYIYHLDELLETIDARNEILDKDYKPFSEQVKTHLLSFTPISEKMRELAEIQNKGIEGLNAASLSYLLIGACGLLHPKEREIGIIHTSGFPIAAASLHFCASQLSDSILARKIHRKDSEIERLGMNSVTTLSQISKDTMGGSCFHQAGMFIWKLLFDINADLISSDMQTAGFIKTWIREPLENSIDLNDVLVSLNEILHEVNNSPDTNKIVDPENLKEAIISAINYVNVNLFINNDVKYNEINDLDLKTTSAALITYRLNLPLTLQELTLNINLSEIITKNYIDASKQDRDSLSTRRKIALDLFVYLSHEANYKNYPSCLGFILQECPTIPTEISELASVEFIKHCFMMGLRDKKYEFSKEIFLACKTRELKLDVFNCFEFLVSDNNKNTINLRFDIASEMLQCGLSLHELEVDGKSIIELAVKNHAKTIALLLIQRADRENCISVWNKAITKNNRELMHFLCNYQILFDDQTILVNPLLIAIYKRNENMCKIILKHIHHFDSELLRKALRMLLDKKMFSIASIILNSSAIDKESIYKDILQRLPCIVSSDINMSVSVLTKFEISFNELCNRLKETDRDLNMEYLAKIIYVNYSNINFPDIVKVKLSSNVIRLLAMHFVRHSLDQCNSIPEIMQVMDAAKRGWNSGQCSMLDMSDFDMLKKFAKVKVIERASQSNQFINEQAINFLKDKNWYNLFEADFIKIYKDCQDQDKDIRLESKQTLCRIRNECDNYFDDNCIASNQKEYSLGISRFLF